MDTKARSMQKDIGLKGKKDCNTILVEYNVRGTPTL